MIFLGIDPGRSGAMVALDEDGKVISMQGLDKPVKVINDWLLDLPLPHMALLEEVHGRGGWGAQHNFTFGRSYQMCRDLLELKGVPFELIRPQAWQAWWGIKKASKDLTKKMATELWPEVRVTKRTAEALLLAEMIRRKTCSHS